MENNVAQPEAITHDYIDRINNYITNSLLMYFKKDQTKAALQTCLQVNPIVTECVWERLKEENPEIFREYNLRLRFLGQISRFNKLVERKVLVLQTAIDKVSASLPSSYGVDGVGNATTSKAEYDAREMTSFTGNRIDANIDSSHMRHLVSDATRVSVSFDERAQLLYHTAQGHQAVHSPHFDSSAMINDGAMPSQIGNLPSKSYQAVHSPHFNSSVLINDGPMPSKIGNLPSQSYQEAVHSTRFNSSAMINDGTMPSQIGNLPYQEAVHSTRFNSSAMINDGTMPSQIGNLSSVFSNKVKW